MRCKKEEFVENAIFHIYNHSSAESDLFKSQSDYEYYISKLKNNLGSNLMEVFAFCLMPNHFHFCVRQNTDYPIYNVFNKVSTSYAMYFNRKYERKGHLFASKLQHKQLTTDNYLIALCQYIHYNPVKAKLVNDIGKWKFSNYQEYINEVNYGIYSKELVEMYPVVFQNYSKTISKYQEHLNEKEFSKLLIDNY